jgi:lipoprotein-anchoring transpeptidase ErfK/SrfK
VQTPNALGAPVLQPADGARTVSPSVHPSVTFAETVTDRAAAERALVFDPPIAGTWQWTAANRAEFLPTGGRLPYHADISLRVQGGPESLRSSAGGYLAQDSVATFTTTTPKKIDVSLRRQVMTLYEDGQALETIPVATGVAGAETPIGTFEVEYKMPQARFVGTNPNGSHYDIPDVHWVLAFYGDYTIHGAYWRTAFGRPGSAGCVSMTDEDARRVFDWADVGTQVTIHD